VGALGLEKKIRFRNHDPMFPSGISKMATKKLWNDYCKTIVCERITR
jgi:hypothetical protein